MSDIDAELTAMQTAYATLSALDTEARTRVLNYLISRLEVTTLNTKSKTLPDNSVALVEADTQESTQSFGSLAELHDAAGPKSNAEKALVAGYWLQVCEGNETFDSQSANTALKHLGDGVANITAAIDSLKNQKPALALQLRKSGKSQQARKVYKITVAGIKAVENMMASH
jgi:hypothetical protein